MDVLTKQILPGQDEREKDEGGKTLVQGGFAIRTKLATAPGWQGKRERPDQLPQKFEYQQREHLKRIPESQDRKESEAGQH